jgi:hypothetical protein
LLPINARQAIQILGFSGNDIDGTFYWAKAAALNELRHGHWQNQNLAVC